MWLFNLLSSKTNKATTILTLIASLAAPMKAGAITQSTLESFQTLKPVYIEVINTEDSKRAEAIDNFKIILANCLYKLDKDIKIDIKDKNYDKALETLQVIKRTLQNINTNLGNLDNEIKQVNTLIANVSTAMGDSDIGDLDINNINFSKNGVYSFGNKVYVIYSEKIKSKNLIKTRTAAESRARAQLILKGLGVNSAEITKTQILVSEITKEGRINILLKWSGTAKISKGETINAVDIAKNLPTLAMK